MSNLKKFEETLGNLDLEVNRLNAVSQAYKKLENLVDSYDNIISKLEENNTAFIKIKDEQNKHLNKIEENFKKINKSISQANLELNKTLENKIDTIRKDNKEFYRDLESTIKIKLDDNKSQIKQLIENERSQIKQFIIDETTKVKNVLLEDNSRKTDVLKRETKSIKISIWVLGVILIIMASVLIYKSFI
jgi:chromosome segregation ATPase